MKTYVYLKLSKIKLLFLSLGIFSTLNLSAQTSISTNHINNNGNGSVIFNVQNTNAFDIIITQFSCHVSTSGATTSQVLYRTTPFSDFAAPWDGGVVGAGQNGWILVGNGNITGSNSVIPVLTNTNVIIPAGATYQFGISSPSIAYMTLTNGAGVNTFSSGGVNLLTGDGISWGGVAYPATPGNYPRGLIGGITFIPAIPCSGIPNGGIITPSAPNVCPALNFTINSTGISGGTGTAYQWQSSPDGFTWNDVIGQNSSTFNGSQTQALSYRLRTICTNGPDTAYSNVVSVGMNPFFNCYCSSGATATSYGYIKRVQLNTIDNTSPSGCGQQYTDFTSIQTNLIEGLSYPISLSLENCTGGTYNYGTRVWIDYNQNGVFDAAEEVFFGNPPVSFGATATINGNIVVPPGSPNGLTRLRIVSIESNASPTACGTYTWGETEDYLVNILPPPANEAGVLAITKPEIAACTLGQQVWVELQNLGTDTLTSADFQVTVSGFALPVANWTGAVPPQSTQEIQIPITYVLADGDSVAVTVSNPNGVVEDPLFAFNNFFSRRVWAGLSGVKSVYGAGADFADVDAAIDALEFRGVCDTVFFQIATGAYTTQHTMVSYPGAGPGKLAVFESATGNAADVSFTRAGTSAADNFVFNFNNADGYMIRNLTARNSGTTFSTVVSFNAGSENNILENNVFIGDTSAVYNIGDFNGVVIASINASNDHGTVIRNNHIMGGNRGLNLGGATGSYETGAVVEGNLIEKYAVIGGIFGNLSGYTVKNNVFRPRTNLTQEVFGVYAVGTIAGADISGNDYQSYRPGSGIFLSNVKGGANEVEVKNNFVFMGDSAGAVLSRGVLIQDVNTSGVLVANNSISFHSDNATSGAITVVDGSEIRFFNNNVGAFGTAPAARIEKPYSVSASDNNNLFGSTVANFVGSSYATLAAFQAASSTDAASLSVNPGFNGTDLHTCTPELNGAALVLAEVTVDFDGDPRSTMPDIGADEFVGDANSLLLEDEFLKCPSDVVTIGNTSLNGVTYSWTPSGNTSEISTSNAGTFVVTATSSCGSFSDTAVVVNKPLPDASFTSTTVGLAAIFTNTSTNGTSYLWDFGDGNTSTAFSPSHAYQIAATYSVTLTVTNDCGTDTFGPVPATVLNVGIEENELASVSLFPNPTNGSFTVTMNNMGADASVITVIDVTGKVVMVKNVPAGENQVTLDATSFASGIYSVKIANGDFSKVIRLVRK